ncbi:hypothetical protein [Desulfovibrio sp. ZJ200]|uniref:hypothetical protein n=1 Tax=Desulfovibrio sp. ZJ200 TaxID=2709792 RepID=UPI0013EE300B|nr:hypothetical protein [Desulfovibrio sp. ZJ200]
MGDGKQLDHFLFENALLTQKRQPPQRGVHSGENRVFRLNATFDFHKKSKLIRSRSISRGDCSRGCGTGQTHLMRQPCGCPLGFLPSCAGNGILAK